MLPKLNLDFETYYNTLETRPPTANMMRWMQFYDQICSKSCCYSTDCGCIRCSSCGISLTKFPPLMRFQCIECPVVAPEAPYNPKPDLCASCFMSDNVLHYHSKWLKITEKGMHSLVIRENGVRELYLLEKTIELFERSSNKDLKLCFICSENFEEDNPAVKFPGCKKDHGNAIKDKTKGIIDSNEHAHRDCLLQWYVISFRDKYCGKPKYCEVCNFEEEMESWEKQFLNAKRQIEELENSKNYNSYKEIFDGLSLEITEKIEGEFQIGPIIKKELLELHPQPWIQQIICKVFI